MVGDCASGLCILIVGTSLSHTQAHIGIVNYHKSITFFHRFILIETYFFDVALHAAVYGHYLLFYLRVVGELDIAEMNKTCCIPTM